MHRAGYIKQPIGHVALTSFKTETIDQWHKRKFKVGGRSTTVVGCGEGLFHYWVKGLGRGQFFCFMISKWHILVNSKVPNLIFFIVSSLSGVRVGRTGVSWALLVYMQNCQPTLLVFNRP